ncbi:hypothetical protein [Massilia sp. S19_KUP03_FR1]|uniref:hypothetical protein n=1 Tax=Massilia sp. S19_KUP03_FR1 TaxID=3025503 RepID=UPI002FCD7634
MAAQIRINIRRELLDFSFTVAFCLSGLFFPKIMMFMIVCALVGVLVFIGFLIWSLVLQRREDHDETPIFRFTSSDAD